MSIYYNTLIKFTKYKIIKKSLAKILQLSPNSLLIPPFSGIINIEPTNLCNLKCPLCPTARGLKREKGFMKFDLFKLIVDRNKNLIKRIIMSFAGEPLLNPYIMKMAQYAEERGISVVISTNATLLDKYLDQILESKLNTLIVCLDGATKETYEQMRVGGNFQKVVDNIYRLCIEKYKRGLDKPHIQLQFLVSKINEHEIKDIIKLGKKLGVDSLRLKTLSLGDWGRLEDKIPLAEKYLPKSKEFRRYKFTENKKFLLEKPPICPLLTRCAILWNGDVIVCCHDYDGLLVVGNIREYDYSLKKIWKDKRYRIIRKKIIRYEPEICKNCGIGGGRGLTLMFK